jgi:hypothetical protein
MYLARLSARVRRRRGILADRFAHCDRVEINTGATFIGVGAQRLGNNSALPGVVT